jgi:amidophosphoribosyltransferase
VHRPRADGTVMIASESVTLEGTGHTFERNVAPGEAVFVDLQGKVHTAQCAQDAKLSPCIFEFVYLARPDSCWTASRLPGAPEPGRDARQARDLHRAAQRDRRGDPDPGVEPAERHAAGPAAGHPYREGFVKNRYVGRTFIMPGQAVRKKSVRQKLNVIQSEFKGRNVLLVDDSIVRGTTSREIVQMARDAGARKVYMASAARRCAFPTSTASTCPRPPSWWRTAARWTRCARSSAATR